MPQYRRAIVPGGTFFFTVVTGGRHPLFADERARWLLGNVIRDCRDRFPWTLDAIVLLPDHLHAIWTLPSGDDGYSSRWSWIKREFTRRWLSSGGNESFRSLGQSRQRRRGVWQPRFWEHAIEDEDDFSNHFDYIHFNPVRHGYVERVRDWPWSSFHRWVRVGVYPPEWGGGLIAEQPELLGRTVGE